MKDTTLSNGVNVEETTPGEPFWPAALALNSAIGGQVFARPHNETVIRILSPDEFDSTLEESFAKKFGPKRKGRRLIMCRLTKRPLGSHL